MGLDWQVQLVDSSGAALPLATLADPFNQRARQIRTNAAIHRSAVTAVDKLAVPAAVTVADVATGGSLVFSTTYNCTMAANSLFGPTTVPAVGAVTMAADAASTHVARVTTAQVARAVSYDVFLSTAANPLWVARITEAQRAAGCTVTAVGTVSATSPGANKVDIQVVGTGLASNVNPFAVNNAYDLSPGGVAITPINCTGYPIAIVQVKFSVTDLRSLPTFAAVILGQIQQDTTSWVQINTVTPTLLTAVRGPLMAHAGVTIWGCTALAVLVDTISGQGASADIYVDLV